jgi:Flp pilus assembly protein TadG
MRHPARKKQHGISAIEFSLTMPFLLFIFGVFIDFGRMYVHYTTLTKAVQDGARWALVGGTENQITLDTDIKNIVVYGKAGGGTTPLLEGFSTNKVSVSESGGYITVSASYQYIPVFVNIPFLTQSLNLTLTASSLMRK